jgi:hypothetical protein
MVLLFRRGRKAPFELSAPGATRSGSTDAFDVKTADYPRPHIGDVLVSGQDIKNGPQAFNLNQLVTSMAGFQVGWNNNGAVSDLHQNTPDTFAEQQYTCFWGNSRHRTAHGAVPVCPPRPRSALHPGPPPHTQAWPPGRCSAAYRGWRGNAANQQTDGSMLRASWNAATTLSNSPSRNGETPRSPTTTSPHHTT